MHEPPPFRPPGRTALILSGLAVLGVLALIWLPILTAVNQPPPDAAARARIVDGLLAAGGAVPVLTAGGQIADLPAANVSLRRIGDCRDGGSGFSFRLGGGGEQGARGTAIFHCPLDLAAEGSDQPVRAVMELRLRQNQPQPDAAFLAGRDLRRALGAP